MADNSFSFFAALLLSISTNFKYIKESDIKKMSTCLCFELKRFFQRCCEEGTCKIFWLWLGFCFQSNFKGFFSKNLREYARDKTRWIIAALQIDLSFCCEPRLYPQYFAMLWFSLFVFYSTLLFYSIFQAPEQLIKNMRIQTINLHDAEQWNIILFCWFFMTNFESTKAAIVPICGEILK